ncbi:hypothetical protein EDD15DRAFT_2204521 [Pisolithus albus]|nr:hypothetical protein EDD15DRAFT_2204521 [Pisolithus albus]
MQDPPKILLKERMAKQPNDSEFTGRRGDSPVSPAKAARRNKSAPYAIPERTLSIGPSYTERAIGDAFLPCCGNTSPGSDKDTFGEVVRRLPKDLVCDALKAQYADCEVTRLRVLTVSWELERLERWQSFHSRSLTYLREQSDVSQQSLEYWGGWCKDQGIGCYPQDRETSRRLLETECSTLEQLRMDFKCNENTAASLGVCGRGAEDFVKPSSLNDSSGEDGSSSSDLEVAGTENPEVPYSSDPEEPPASDPVVSHHDSSDSDYPLLLTSPTMKRRARKNLQKPGRDSDLNPSLLPSASQLGIPSEFTPDPYEPTYPTLVEDVQNDTNYTTYFDDIDLYDRAGGSSHIVDTVRSSALPTYSIDPSNATFQSAYQPPQRITRPTPYPSDLGIIRNVRAFGPLRSMEEERGQLMRLGVIQAVSDVAITGPVRQRPIRNRPSAMQPRAEHQNPSMGAPISQAPPILTSQAPPTQNDPILAVPASAVSADTKKQIIFEAKRYFRREIITRLPFPSQEASNDLSRTSVDTAIRTILGDSPHWTIDKICSAKALLSIVTNGNSMRSSFKSAARSLVPSTYALSPNISEMSSLDSTAISIHYKQRVDELLTDYKFLYEQDGLRRFGHTALIELPLVVLWAQPGDKCGLHIDEDLFRGVLALAAMAIISTLREYQTDRTADLTDCETTADYQLHITIKGIADTKRLLSVRMASHSDA